MIFFWTEHINRNLMTQCNGGKQLCALKRFFSQVHGQEKSFHCSQCDKSFKELRTLRLHLKIHNSEYPEHCEVCKKGFRTKWQVGSSRIYEQGNSGGTLGQSNLCQFSIDFGFHIAKYNSSFCKNKRGQVLILAFLVLHPLNKV